MKRTLPSRSRLPRSAQGAGAAALAAVVLLAAAAHPAPASSSAALPPRSPDATVRATNTISFEPRTVTIPVGGTVEWINASVLVHTVTDDPEKATVEGSWALPDGAEGFDSGNLAPDATFSHTFTVPGTYRYFCIPHEGAKMWGTVVVE